MTNIASFVCGLIFGIGLILAGMANPAKVIAFLDLAGQWDPSLAFVMGGGIAVASGAFAVAGRRARSLLGAPMQIPGRRDLEPRLILGSLAFGAGWGLAGFCPGPALVALGAGLPPAANFVGAMLVGMLGYELINRARLSAPAQPQHRSP